MSSRASTICHLLLLTLLVAGQAVPAFAKGCDQAASSQLMHSLEGHSFEGRSAEVMEAGSPAHHPMHSKVAGSEAASAADCCADSEHCNMQACLGGAAVPASASEFDLPATIVFLSSAPVIGASLVPLPLQRPPILA